MSLSPPVSVAWLAKKHYFQAITATLTIINADIFLWYLILQKYLLYAQKQKQITID